MASPSTPTTIAEGLRSRAASVRALIESLRPRQWVKNGFVFAALIFSRNLTNWRLVAIVALAACVFSGVSSAAYLLNDVLDVDEDRKHPLKRLRPVASGRLAPRTAILTAIMLAAAGLFTASKLDLRFFLVVASY